MARLNAAGSSTCGRWPQPDKISAWASGSRAAARWAWPRGRSRSWSAPDQQQGWRGRAFLSGRRTGEPVNRSGTMVTGAPIRPNSPTTLCGLNFRSVRDRHGTDPAWLPRGGTREPGGWRPGCGATWVMAAPAAHLCRQAMSGCGGGQVLRPEGGRGGPRAAGRCAAPPNEPIVRGGGSTAWRGSPELRSRACQLRRARLTLLPSNVRPAADSSPIPTGMGRQQPKTRTRR